MGAAVVDRRRGQRLSREEMADDRGDVGIVEVACDEDCGVGIGVVVPGYELEPAPVDPALGVDLLGGQLGRLLHWKPSGIGKRPGDPDPHDVT
jgi:hypothetical protein